MKLITLDKKEFDKFSHQNELTSIYELSAWGDLKKKTGWYSHYVGFKDKENIICATLLLEKRTPLKKSLFYSPRGFLLDAKNYKLLSDFTEEIKKYIKKNNGFMLKVDPNIIYKINDEVIGNQEYQNYVKCGFKHFGFNENFETLQPRILCRFNLLEDYEKTESNFQKSTRKNIHKSSNMGVVTRPIKDDEFNEFMRILGICADKNHFIIRPNWYYETLRKLFKDEVTYYITYIDVEKYFSYLNSELASLSKEEEELKIKLEKYNVGEKLKNEKKQLIIRKEKLTEKIKNEKERFKNKKYVYIGALMSIFLNKEGITFMSGTDPLYKDFYPKYSYYAKHIKDSIDKGEKYCNFYGISKDFNPKGKYYGIYEIKKGFNPDIIELLGEFDLVTNRFIYIIYKLALKAYKLAKKIKH